MGAQRRVGVLAGQLQAESGGLLDGLRVVELATVIAAPSACALLADYGAEVIKVENPDAPDYVRSWRKRDTRTADPAGQVGSGFTQFNRGKRSAAIDIGQPDGRAALLALLGKADVLVTNVRLRSLEKLKLDYHSLRDQFPRLIYGHLSAWGLTGPRRDDPGYDVGAFYAYSGMMELCRSSDRAPLPRYPAGFGDTLTGTQLLAGVALALLDRHRTGVGQLVDVCLLRAGLWALSHPLTAHAGGNSFAAGESPVVRSSTERGQRRTMITDGAFECRDGRWVQLLGVETRRHWSKTVKALGLEGKLEVGWEKARNSTDWAAATRLVDAVMLGKDYSEWHRVFEAADVWHTPINQYEDLMADQHANATNAFAQVTGLRHKLVRNPILLSGQQGLDGPKARAPAFGEHTRQVLEEHGYCSQQIDELIHRGVVKCE